MEDAFSSQRFVVVVTASYKEVVRESKRIFSRYAEPSIISICTNWRRRTRGIRRRYLINHKLFEIMSSAVLENHPSSLKMPNQRSNNRRTSNNFSTISQKKFKHDRSGRKRSKSFSGGGPMKMKSMKPVLPTKFLLGGNINDPLNLNSLQDEDINRAMNAVTPKSSPIPTPPRRKGQVEVIIPPNINDPLDLIGCADEAEFEQQLCSPIKKGRKKRLRKKRTMSATVCSITEINSAANNDDIGGTSSSEAKTPESRRDSAKIPEGSEVTTVENESEGLITEVNLINRPVIINKELNLDLSPKKDKNKRKSDDHKENVKKMKYSMDKIVSPVIPQPGAWLKRSNSQAIRHVRPARAPVDQNHMPKFKEKNKQYQYGNYNRYYGYRNPNNELDPRLRCFSYHHDLFEGKDILDIGCNIGHITLSVARDFGAKSIVGLDIDKSLIGIARKNVKYYVSSAESPRNKDDPSFVDLTAGPTFFVNSAKIDHNDHDDIGKRLSENKRKEHGFPYNVSFVQGNYILDDETLLTMEQPQFDVILCLSVTKWFHLNWGDAGIKQSFRRMYAQLRPGGKLILEPQNWSSYKGKKKLTEEIYKNYNSIEFFPEKFTQYLLSPEIGFAKSEILGFPQHHSRGFQRPIQVFTKSTMFPSERVEGPLNPEFDPKVYAPVSDIDYSSLSQDFSPCETNHHNNCVSKTSNNSNSMNTSKTLTQEERLVTNNT
ncbi:7SK snRNA methylphosphate capping enzyme-like isoform X3 [Onthophagus taurus]|uniref:7SK snRNA methylphosphate capping enzyme-like isoform X3 n=1 Tax=Onthophagus taurus TaxID=166361 RepID=UPI0039BDE97D